MADEMEETTWQSRKQKVREAYYTRLAQDPETGDDLVPTPPTPGNAPSPDVVPVDLFEPVGRRGRRTTGTSATATAPAATPPKSPVSSTPVETTSDSSESSMVWMVSPLGFIEQNLKPSIVAPNGSLVPGLSTAALASLQALATGRAEPIEEVVWQIADFFVSEEDERAEGTMLDMLEFYCLHYATAGA